MHGDSACLIRRHDQGTDTEFGHPCIRAETGLSLGASAAGDKRVGVGLNPKHLGTLMDDPLGQRMIMVAIVLQVLGVLAIRKLVDIEY